jgi:hypothetical protein
MSEDSMDLPMRSATKLPVPNSTAASTNRGALSEQQVNMLIQGGAVVAEQVVSAARDYLAIVRIRAESQATVDEIDARSRAVCNAIRAEADRLMVVRDTIKSRGDAAVQVIRAVMDSIPETDHAGRKIAIEELSKLVTIAVSGSDAPATPKP